MSNILAGFFAAAPSAPDGQGGANAASSGDVLGGIVVSAHSDESSGKGFEDILEGSASSLLPEAVTQAQEEGEVFDPKAGSEHVNDAVQPRVLSSGIRTAQTVLPVVEVPESLLAPVSGASAVRVSADSVVEQDVVINEGEKADSSPEDLQPKGLTVFASPARPIVAEGEGLGKTQPEEAIPVGGSKEAVLVPIKAARPLGRDNGVPATKGRLLEFVRDILGNEEPPKPLVDVVEPTSEVFSAESRESTPSVSAQQVDVGVTGKALPSPELDSGFNRGGTLEQNVLGSVIRRDAGEGENLVAGLSVSESGIIGSAAVGFRSKEVAGDFRNPIVFSENEANNLLDSNLGLSLTLGEEAYGFKDSTQPTPEKGPVSRWIESSLSLGIYEDTETALKTEGFNPLIMRTAVNIPLEEDEAQLYVSEVLAAFTPTEEIVSMEGSVLRGADQDSSEIFDAPSKRIVLNENSRSGSARSTEFASFANVSEEGVPQYEEIEGVVASLTPLESRSVAHVNTLSFSEKVSDLSSKPLVLSRSGVSDSVEGSKFPDSSSIVSQAVQVSAAPLNKENDPILYTGNPLINRSLDESKGLPLVYSASDVVATAKGTATESTEDALLSAEGLHLDSAVQPVITATNESGDIKKEGQSTNSVDSGSDLLPGAYSVPNSEHEVLANESHDLPGMAQVSTGLVSGKAVISERESKSLEAKSTDFSGNRISVTELGSTPKSSGVEVAEPRQAGESSIMAPVEVEEGEGYIPNSSNTLPAPIDSAVIKEESTIHPEARSLSGAMYSKETPLQRPEAVTVQQSESALDSPKNADKVEELGRVEGDLLPKLDAKPQPIPSSQVFRGQQVLSSQQEGVKNSPKPLLDRILQQAEMPGLDPSSVAKADALEGDVDVVSKAGMPIAQQPPRMHSRSQRTLEPTGAPISSLESEVSTAPVSGYAQKETNTAPFAQAPSEGVSHSSVLVEEESRDTPAQNKDLMPVPQRLQQSATSQSIESFSPKMRSEPLPSVPDLNPKLLRQLEQFQRSQRPWAKISLPMSEGEDLMLRMKVSSGHVQIRFGTQSAPLRDGLERGWSELVNQAASRGIQLDSPEFEARLKTRALGLEGAVFAESSDDGDKPLKSFKRKSANNGQSIDPNEPLDDYPGVLKWA